MNIKDYPCLLQIEANRYRELARIFTEKLEIRRTSTEEKLQNQYDYFLRQAENGENVWYNKPMAEMSKKTLEDYRRYSEDVLLERIKTYTSLAAKYDVLFKEWREKEEIFVF